MPTYALQSDVVLMMVVFKADYCPFQELELSILPVKRATARVVIHACCWSRYHCRHADLGNSASVTGLRSCHLAGRRELPFHLNKPVHLRSGACDGEMVFVKRPDQVIAVRQLPLVGQTILRLPLMDRDDSHIPEIDTPVFHLRCEFCLLVDLSQTTQDLSGEVDPIGWTARQPNHEPRNPP